MTNKNLKYIATVCGAVFACAVLYKYGTLHMASTHSETHMYQSSDNSTTTQQYDSLNNISTESINTNCTLNVTTPVFANNDFANTPGFMDKIKMVVHPSETTDAASFHYTATCDCDISINGGAFVTKQLQVSGVLQYNKMHGMDNPGTDGVCDNVCGLLCNEYYNSIRRNTEFTGIRPQVITAAKNVMYNLLAANPDISNLTVIE